MCLRSSFPTLQSQIPSFWFLPSVTSRACDVVILSTDDWIFVFAFAVCVRHPALCDAGWVMQVEAFVGVLTN